jgi:hypothetical protein
MFLSVAKINDRFGAGRHLPACPAVAFLNRSRNVRGHLSNALLVSEKSPGKPQDQLREEDTDE